MKWHDQQDRLRHVKWDDRSMPDWAYFVIVLALMVAITVNYLYLGRKEPYVAELFILPVMVAAFRYKILGGFLCGVATALFAGPIAFELMQPHWVAPGAPQYEDWLFLLVYSSVMGIVIGLFVQLQQRHKDEALRLQCQDPVTGLANLEGLRKIMSELLSDTSQPVRSFSKYAIRINNYQSLINAFGYRSRMNSFAGFRTISRHTSRTRTSLPVCPPRPWRW